LNNLISQTETSIQNCQHKKQTIQHEYHNMEHTRKTLCSTLEDNGKKELLKMQQKWKKEERKRLVDLAKQKTAELKKQAAKALEPEISRIIRDHKDALQQKREEIELELKTVKEQLTLDFTDLYTKKRRNVETEERQLLQQTDEEYERKIRELNMEYETMVTDTRRLIQDEKEAAAASQKAFIQEKEDILKAQVLNTQCENERKIEESNRMMEVKLRNFNNAADEKVSIAMKQQQE
jgi:hypothetical protein